MSRLPGGVPSVWIVGMLVGAALTAAASFLLAYRTSPAVAVGLPLFAVVFWVILRYGAQTLQRLQRYGVQRWVQRYGVVGLLILLLLCIPLGRVTFAEIGGVAVSPVTTLVVVLTALWLWQALTGSERIEFSHMQVPLAIFLLWGTVGLYGALDTPLGLKYLFTFVMGALVYFITSQTIRSLEEAQGIIWAVAVTAGIIGVYALVTWISVDPLMGDQGAAQMTGDVPSATLYYNEEGEAFVRSEGIFGHPNGLGEFLALCIPTVVALTTSENLGWRRVSGYLLFVAATLGLIFTYSRGAWIGTVVGLLILLLVLRRRVWPVLGLLGLALTIAVTAGGATFTRLQSIISAENDPAVTSRQGIWDAALRLVEEHPLLGVGLGNFREAYENLLIPNLPLLSPDLKVPNDAHNLFLHLGAEVGVVGAAAFAWLLAVAFLKAWQVRRSADLRVRIWSLGLAAGLVAILTQSTIDVVTYQGFSNILFFTYLGILDALRRFDRSQTEYERMPLTAPASIIGSPQRGIPSIEYADSGRSPVAPACYTFHSTRKADIPLNNPLRDAGLGRTQTENTSGDESD